MLHNMIESAMVAALRMVPERVFDAGGFDVIPQVVAGKWHPGWASVGVLGKDHAVQTVPGVASPLLRRVER